MAIPKFDEITRPLLNYMARQTDSKSRSELYQAMVLHFKLTEEEATQKFPGGRQIILVNRMSWAIIYLQKAGLLEKTSRGMYRITDLGKAESKDFTDKITQKYLRKYPGFKEFSTVEKKIGNNSKSIQYEEEQSTTPEEDIANAFKILNSALIADLRENIAKMDPYDFEQLVVDLLVAMGYGGLNDEQAFVTQKSNDEGIDGVINQDKLGLDTIYLQAKRWQSDISRKEIQSFAGALLGKQANKGVFITTSKFSKNAIEYVEKPHQQKIILIDGDKLADLMIKHDIGVSTYATYHLKRVDLDYFIKD